ncbi:hypothetical protein GCM10025857_14730 [Alicyclobacillus contaminans]|nr:hypothetical protein GCM10025857_14730 [Alicyclobacillus contaminans]
MQIYNNSTNALVLDTGTITTTMQQYTIPANTLVNRTVYKVRVMYTDSVGNASPWSTYVVFTCSSTPSVTITSPTVSQTVASNVVQVTASYAQAQGVLEQSYRIVVYGSDQSTIVADSGTLFNTANLFTVNGLSNGNYYAQATVTSADGLSATSAKVPFTVAYTSPSQTPSISATPLPEAAAIRLDWHNPQENPATYLGPGPTYRQGKWGQAIQVAAYGEKVYWQLTAFAEFVYLSWFITNQASNMMTAHQVIAHLHSNSLNFIQLRYDPSDSKFVLEQCINGRSITTKSEAVTFSSGAQGMVALRQDESTIAAFVCIGGEVYKITPQAYTANPPNTYGKATYGSGTYASSVSGTVQDLNTVFVGCAPADGQEANMLFDQTLLTGKLLTDNDIQSIYLNSIQQTYDYQTMFLANFDGTLEGGDVSGTAIDHWQIVRLYNGQQKLLGTVQKSENPTLSFVDSTPLADATYQYNIVPYDANGNSGPPMIVQGSVSFDGWWLTDPDTGVSFQFYLNVGDVEIQTNYGRNEYKTFGRYPVVAYAPTRYRTGKLSGWVVDQFMTTQTPYEQYQTLQSMIDAHKPLLLRGMKDGE